VAGFSHRFTEPEGFAGALQGGQFEYLPMPGQAFQSKLQVLAMGGLLLQVAQMGSHVARGAMLPGLSVVMLQLGLVLFNFRMSSRWWS
jgi:hypothetical protein